MKFLTHIFLSLFQLHRFAQEDVEVVPATSPKSKYDSIRSIYIKSYPDHFFLWPVLKQRQAGFRNERCS